jgi:hypothetical protein
MIREKATQDVRYKLVSLLKAAGPVQPRPARLTPKSSVDTAAQARIHRGAAAASAIPRYLRQAGLIGHQLLGRRQPGETDLELCAVRRAAPTAITCASTPTAQNRRST